MKIKSEHFEYMLSKIPENLRKKPEDLEVSHLRYGWDLIWKFVGVKWICDNIYPYADDSHIETAINKILIK